MVAARLFAMKRPTREIAVAVDRNEQTVRAWNRAWREQGVEGLRSKPHPGREPKLSKAQWRQVLKELSRPA